MSPSTTEEGASRPAGLAAVLVAVIAGMAVAVFAGLAFAKSPTTLKSATNSTLGEKIAVNSKGRTVYRLSPETSHHLLCTSAACFKFWPPVKVSKTGKLSAVAGIKGRLGRIHRGRFYQLTLGGDPLYTFAGDTGANMANGNGIKSFGGTWHVVSAGKLPAMTTPKPTTTTTTTTTPSPTTSTTTTNPYWA